MEYAVVTNHTYTKFQYLDLSEFYPAEKYEKRAGMFEAWVRSRTRPMSVADFIQLMTSHGAKLVADPGRVLNTEVYQITDFKLVVTNRGGGKSTYTTFQERQRPNEIRDYRSRPKPFGRGGMVTGGGYSGPVSGAEMDRRQSRYSAIVRA